MKTEIKDEIFDSFTNALKYSSMLSLIIILGSCEEWGRHFFDIWNLGFLILRLIFLFILIWTITLVWTLLQYKMNLRNLKKGLSRSLNYVYISVIALACAVPVFCAGVYLNDICISHIEQSRYSFTESDKLYLAELTQQALQKSGGQTSNTELSETQLDFLQTVLSQDEKARKELKAKGSGLKNVYVINEYLSNRLSNKQAMIEQHQLSGELAANSAKAVEYVAHLLWGIEKAGEYSSGAPALIVTCQITLVDVKGRDILKVKMIKGSVKNKRVSESNVTGPAPYGEIIDYLQSLILIRNASGRLVAFEV